MRKTTQLRRLIEDPRLLVMPGAYDVLSAMLIERAGFGAVQCSGLGFSASLLGKPDASLLSFREMVERTYQIAGAVEIPVMADADAGFGNAVNVWECVRELERVGAAGMSLEDQVLPRRSPTEGKAVIPLDEMLLKLEAALDARRDPDFVVNARTDALGPLGLDEAIGRANAFLRAGATLVFVEGLEAEEQIRRCLAEIDGPVSINLAEDGRTPMLSFAELETLGAARVSCPATTLLAAMQAVEDALSALRTNGGPAGHMYRLMPFARAQALLGVDRVRELEQRYLAPDADG